MFTIKYTDQDGMERLAQGRDVRAVKDGRHVKSLGWLDCVAGEGCQINFPTTAYVMNESGATVAKYVVVGEQEATPGKISGLLKGGVRPGARPFVPIAPEKRSGVFTEPAYMARLPEPNDR